MLKETQIQMSMLKKIKHLIDNRIAKRMLQNYLVFATMLPQFIKCYFLYTRIQDCMVNSLLLP